MLVFQVPGLVLVALTLLAFFLLPTRCRLMVLIISGLLFYAWAGGSVLLLAVGLIVATYVAPPRVSIWINAAVLIGLMSYLKLRSGWLIVPEGPAGTGLAGFTLPLGLSFLTFELIHVAVERQRGRLPNLSLAGLAAFALYFPCRMAGPIKRYQPFIDSVQQAHGSWPQLYRGFTRVLWGYLKKVAVADVLVLLTPQLTYPTTTGPLLWVSLTAFSLYIYIDFSAYSDVAIGLSQAMGISVPENFRLPYFSRNIREFWTRWHISLSTWLGDYVYLPVAKRLTRSRWALNPKSAALVSYLITFALCGLWHGPAWHFLLWGLYHGILLCAYAVYASSKSSRSAAGQDGSRTTAFLFRIVTFSLVTYGWLFFVLEPRMAFHVTRRLFGLGA